MSTTITATPAYPVANTPVIIGFSTASGNFVKAYYTDAPIGSKVKTELLKTKASRIAAFTSDAGKTVTLTPELPGVYTFTIEEFTKGASSHGGAYQDDPAGFQTETLLSTTTGITLSVGQKVTQRVGTGPDTATLTLFIVEATVRRSTEELHGFTSPLISDAKTGKAETAMLNTAIVAAVDALADVTVATMLGSPSTVLDDLITKFDAHLTQATVHDSNDTDNAVSSAFSSPTTPVGMQNTATELLRRLRWHMRNDDGAGGGVGSKVYHKTGGVNHADWVNVLLVSAAGDIRDTIVAIADLWRAYEAHRVSTAVHTNADNTNSLTALPALLNIHRLFLAELQKYGPTAPASVNAGVTTLIHGAGFEEAN
jgi:hypothetical protein